MHDANDLVRAMQQVSSDATAAGAPATIMSGTVISGKPLKIKVEQRFEIGGSMLIVPEHLTDHEIRVTVRSAPIDSGDDSVQYSGEMIVTVHGGLQSGDNVQLIRQQGGQKFLVIGKVV